MWSNSEFQPASNPCAGIELNEPSRKLYSKNKKSVLRGRRFPLGKCSQIFSKFIFYRVFFGLKNVFFRKMAVKIELNEPSRKLYSKNKKSNLRGRRFPLGKCFQIFSKSIFDPIFRRCYRPGFVPTNPGRQSNNGTTCLSPPPLMEGDDFEVLTRETRLKSFFRFSESTVKL